MKIIKFPNLEIKGVEDVVYELSKASLNRAPKQGFTPDVMRKRIKVLDIIVDRETSDVLELEDADYDTYKKAVNDMTWRILDKEILKFIDAINNATDPKSVQNEQAGKGSTEESDSEVQEQEATEEITESVEPIN